ncbi:MAG: hypothetical protein ACYTGA_03855 [Planctomycetota bacterium]|jgi:hypothetical protein
MFVFYTCDNCIEYRPWLAYLTFPAIVVAAFVLAVEGPIPEPRSMLVFNIVGISGLVVLAYMITAFFTLWTFGRAVCSKVGNIVYVVTLALSVMLGFGVIIALGEDTIWLLSWVVHCLAGMFLIFCPLNSLDCFFYIPPFKPFSINGLVAVIVWLITDFLFCASLGWSAALLLHPLSFVFGLLLASLFLKISFVGDGIGDITIWQWIKGENPDKDLAWKDSWSVKRQEKMQQQQQEQQRENTLIKKEKELVEIPNIDGTEETTSVLCQCGQIIYAPIRFEGKTIKCTICNHLIHIPKLEEFK